MSTMRTADNRLRHAGGTSEGGRFAKNTARVEAGYSLGASPDLYQQGDLFSAFPEDDNPAPASAQDFGARAFDLVAVRDLRPGMVNSSGQEVADVVSTRMGLTVVYVNGDTATFGDPHQTILVGAEPSPALPPESQCAHLADIEDCRCLSNQACRSCVSAGCVNIKVKVGTERNCLACGTDSWYGTLCRPCQEDLDDHLGQDRDPGARARGIDAVRALRKGEKESPYGRDTLVVDGTRYTRLREGVWPETPYSTRIEASRDLTPQEAERVAQLFGYAYATTGGERAGDPTDADTPRSLIFATDTTKNRAYERLDRFAAMLQDPAFLRDGSPVRTTNRAGEGTKGTRLIEGLGEGAPTLSVYFDSVWQ